MNPYYTDLKDVIVPLTAITSFVRTNSSSWEESADILPTVTNFFSGNTVKLSGLNVTGNTQINTDTFRLTGVVIGKNTQVSFNTSTATGENSFAAGRENTAQGTASFAEGYYTLATGTASHAEGFQTKAEGIGAHAEGGSTPGPTSYTRAAGNFSHAEGTQTQALGNYSHSQGQWTVAMGEASHAAGSYVTAQHDRTWAWRGSTGTTRISTTRADQFMVSADGGIYLPSKVGIGTDNNLNALTVAGILSTTGDSAFTGNVNVSGQASFANDVSIFKAAFGYGTNPAGQIHFSDAAHSTELGFIDDSDQVLATKNNGGWEYGGGSPGSATLRVSSDGNSQTRFDVSSLLVVLPNLPTSSTGLPVGALWNDSGTVKVKQ